MLMYILRRSIMAVPIIIGVATITFLLTFVFVPGDPIRMIMGQNADPETVAAIRHEMGLDQPLSVQYVRFIGKIFKGDLGRSFKTKRTVVSSITERFPATLRLATAAMVIGIIVGVSAGIISAVKPYSIWDNIFMTLALLGISVPVFYLGLLLIIVLALQMDLFPVGGFGGGAINYLILPAIALGTGNAARIARMTRSSLLEVIRMDYIRTARSKGLNERVVIFKHALRNAMIPVVTVIGTQMGYLLGGTVLTETTFSWPGVGRLAIDAVQSRDFPMIQGTVLFLAIIFIVINLLVDLSYGWLDPRIRYE
ncbi:MAG: ABC transporter permease [Halanaerobiales bacterium]|nr:ABC transporter permease [Halanaerobiales bacterium]